MGLSQDLREEVRSTFASPWESQDANEVPSPEALRLNSNHAKTLKSATILYADLDGSTNMVDTYAWWFSAEVYKTYLRCAGQIIRAQGGTITAYDGDRIMAIYTGKSKNTSAVRTALRINWAVEEIIRPAINERYSTNFILKHVVGVDTGMLRAARIGVKGDNDLVWVGHAANHAAKLCDLSEQPLWISGDVYDNMNDAVKFTNGAAMWRQRSWTNMQDKRVFCSNYRQSFYRGGAYKRSGLRACRRLDLPLAGNRTRAWADDSARAKR
jgi:class 3 adenylate cyclase